MTKQKRSTTSEKALRAKTPSSKSTTSKNKRITLDSPISVSKADKSTNRKSIEDMSTSARNGLVQLGANQLFLLENSGLPVTLLVDKLLVSGNTSNISLILSDPEMLVDTVGIITDLKARTYLPFREGIDLVHINSASLKEQGTVSGNLQKKKINVTVLAALNKVPILFAVAL